MSDKMDELVDALSAEVIEQADKALLACEEYAEHVFSGGDVSKLPNGDHIYNSPVSGFAQRIVNAYREEQGKVVNPYQPFSLHYKLFDRLLRAIDEGEPWVPAKTLSGYVMGSRVDTYLKNHHLKRWGWTLAKSTIGGKVHFALAKYSEVTGKVPVDA